MAPCVACVLKRNPRIFPNCHSTSMDNHVSAASTSLASRPNVNRHWQEAYAVRWAPHAVLAAAIVFVEVATASLRGFPFLMPHSDLMGVDRRVLHGW